MKAHSQPPTNKRPLYAVKIEGRGFHDNVKGQSFLYKKKDIRFYLNTIMSSQSQNLQNAPGHPSSRSLSILHSTQTHNFIKPVKRINEGHDVPHFLTSRAYGDIGIFVMQLNISMCPRKYSATEEIQTWKLDSPLDLSEPVRKLQELLRRIDAIIEEAPPDTGPRRFGNVSFRRWHEILEFGAEDLLQAYLPPDVLNFGDPVDGVSVLDELTPYLLGGFGSSQRLDYGTGHELSFLAFLGCIWKLGGFTKDFSGDGALERSIVLGVIEPYVMLTKSRHKIVLSICAAIYRSFVVSF
jgi:serine/threonine-protein phosphatase 2A activator